jgi:hypothetical protein
MVPLGVAPGSLSGGDAVGYDAGQWSLLAPIDRLAGMKTDPPAAASSGSGPRPRLGLERTLPFLVYRDSDGEQHVVVLETAASRITVGRGKANDVALTWDLEVSRLHAQLERVGPEWTVVDDGLSRNGTWVNGERLSGRHRLLDGDSLRFGGTSILYHDPRRGEPPTAVAADLPSMIQLSEAQRRVLTALCRPYKHGSPYATPATNQQIAEELFLSVDAVKTHLRGLFQKFGVEGLPQNQKRARLVERAFHAGLVSDRDL